MHAGMHAFNACEGGRTLMRCSRDRISLSTCFRMSSCTAGRTAALPISTSCACDEVIRHSELGRREIITQRMRLVRHHRTLLGHQ